MEPCNEEEAIRAKHAALENGKRRFQGSPEICCQSTGLYPDLDSVMQMILVCNVHCSAAEVVCEDEMDWYKILDVDATADEASIRVQQTGSRPPPGQKQVSRSCRRLPVDPGG
ncbi:UNVERIFIED_CONTAM: hypothetical protein Sradi_3655800 [Sesamum radiatum]|uniref:Uncharacterized protein n=1 Tax=Sesamum radiatum TaxID=300843 RepID=A0AAW2QIH1_SESRA